MSPKRNNLLGMSFIEYNRVFINKDSKLSTSTLNLNQHDIAFYYWYFICYHFRTCCKYDILHCTSQILFYFNDLQFFYDKVVMAYALFSHCA